MNMSPSEAWVWLSGIKDGFAALAFVVSIVSLSFAIFKGRYDQITGVKPALVFVFDHEVGWEIQNIGSGPALNIIIAKKEGGIISPTVDWMQPVRVPPLKKDGKFGLHWDPENNTDGLGSTYEDMWGRKYTTTCGDDLNVIRRGTRIKGWKNSDIQREWALRKTGYQ